MIYAPQPPVPIRVAYQDRSNKGGGFIEFLFGDAPQGNRYQRDQAYQPQPDYGYGGRRMLLPPMDPQQSMRREEEEIDPAQQRLDPKYENRYLSALCAECHGNNLAGKLGEWKQEDFIRAGPDWRLTEREITSSSDVPKNLR